MKPDLMVKKVISLRIKILLPLLMISALFGFYDVRIAAILSVFSLIAYGFVKLAIVKPIQLLQNVIEHRSDWENVTAVGTPGQDEIEHLAMTIDGILGQLSDSEEKFRQMAENIRAVFWMTDPERKKVIYVSPAIEDMWGIRPEDLYNDPSLWLKSIFSDDQENVANSFQRVGDGHFDVEYRIKRPDGKVIWVHDRGYSVKDHRGRLVRIARMSTDISERKQAEDALKESEAYNRHLVDELEVAKTNALQAARAKGEFLANMSHEIRTPMNGVIGTLELLCTTELTAEQQELANTASRSAEFLLEIINDVLDFSKLEAKKVNIQNTVFNLMVVIEDVVEMLALKAGEKGIELAFRYSPSTPVQVAGDPARIKQILVNLIGNAVKFTERGHVFINVECGNLVSGQGAFSISIEDTGIGIPSDKTHSIFETFTQVDSSTSRRYSGTGLGLTICRQLAHLMNGSIEVKSQLGVGSTFTFHVTLPVVSSSSMESGSDSFENLNITIVDDNECNQRILCELLETKGNHCEIYSSGGQALSAIQHSWNHGNQVHMVLIDQKLPLMQGESLARKIKEDKVMGQSELILLTTMGGSSDIQNIRQAGFSGYLIKPIRPSQLIKTLSQIWSKKLKNSSLPGPVSKPVEDVAGEKPMVAESDAKRIHSQILLVDDNPINQEVSLKMLRKLGCEVDSAVNGIEAVQKIKDYPYSMVFMDCQMPGMDGYQATRSVRELEKESGDHVPIVAMTAHALEGDREKCLESGMDDYISKPVKLKDFQNMLEKWLVHLDPAVMGDLQSLGGSDLAFRTKIFNNFITDTENRLRDIREKLTAGDMAGVRDLAHAIRGSSGTLGVKRMFVLSTRLELMGNVTNGEASRFLNGLEAEYYAVKPMLLSLIDLGPDQSSSLSAAA